MIWERKRFDTRLAAWDALSSRDGDNSARESDCFSSNSKGLNGLFSNSAVGTLGTFNEVDNARQDAIHLEIDDESRNRQRDVITEVGSINKGDSESCIFGEALIGSLLIIAELLEAADDAICG